MAERIRWGVVGSGGIARRRTIPEGLAAARNATLVTVYDANTELNRQVASYFRTRAASSIEELLAAGIDAVYIASPPGFHSAQALECARAGKHVLCEKPLALEPSEAERMVDIFKHAGLQLGTAFMMRFQSQHQAALKLIRAGKLGRPVYGRAQLSCWYPPIPGAWRQNPAEGGGGSLIDMGGHCIDLLEMFFGPVYEVTCLINRTVHPYQSEDSAVALLRFENGTLANVDTFFCIPDSASENRLELYGSLGSILGWGTISQAGQGRMTAHLTEVSGGYDAQQTRDSAAGFEIAPAPVNIYRAEIEEFSQALLEGHPSVLSGEVGVRSQRVLAACYQSAAHGSAVRIDDTASSARTA